MGQNKSILLIPHYNNPKGLLKSLQSVGSTEKIDVIIIDDGSKEIFNEIDCNNFFHAKGAINYLYLKKNKGIEIAMNKGLAFAKEKQYTYIARLDCGDLNVSNRFKIQEDYLDNNPDISIVGSHSDFFGMDGTTLFTQRNPLKPQQIKNKLFFNSTFVHPTIMFRTALLNTIEGYPTEYPSAEDYAMYMALNEKGIQMANIDLVLLKTELNPNGISLSRRRDQLTSRIKLIWKHFYWGYYPIMGLIRNLIIYITPFALLLQLKKIVKK